MNIDKLKDYAERKEVFSDNQEIVDQLEKLGESLNDMRLVNADDFHEYFISSDIYFVKEAVVHLWGLYDDYKEIIKEIEGIKNG
tara:strand:- start:318 stop:569 length:252 start_codon:yes stop_codon:yes gene_type:complete